MSYRHFSNEQHDSIFRDVNQFHHPPSGVESHNGISSMISEYGNKNYCQEILKPHPCANTEILKEKAQAQKVYTDITCVPVTKTSIWSTKLSSFVGLAWTSQPVVGGDQLAEVIGGQLAEVTDDDISEEQQLKQQYNNDDIHIEPTSPVECEDKVASAPDTIAAQTATVQNISKKPQETNRNEVYQSVKEEAQKATVSLSVTCPETEQMVEEVSPLKPGKPRSNATVRYTSKRWKRNFPVDKEVDVQHKINEYLDEDGHRVTLIIEKVPKMDEKMLTKRSQLDGSKQLDTFVAYLEDDDSGYIVREQLKSLKAVLAKIADQIAKFNKTLQPCVKQTWHRMLKERDKLMHRLNSLIISMINSLVALHKCNYVSLNVTEDIFFVRTTCDCWATPACFHEMTVVLGGCDQVYPDCSTITGDPDSEVYSNPSSRALQLAKDHKYKTVRTVYDKLDVVITIVNVLTRFCGLDNCEEVTVGELFKACSIHLRIMQKIEEYCMISRIHCTTTLQWEHEV